MNISPVQPGDSRIVSQWLNNTALMRRAASEPPCFERPWYLFLIRLSDGTPVGWVELFNVDIVNRKAEVGIAIPDPRGRGLSLRALRQLCRFAFDVLGLHRLVARIPESNRDVPRLAERLGARLEGRERQARLVDGRYEDVLVYGLLADEFRWR